MRLLRLLHPHRLINSTKVSKNFNCKSFLVAWMEKDENSTETWETIYSCRKCAPGCEECIGPEPCLATYHWPFRSVTAPPHAPHSISLIYRITLLVFSLCCVLCTVVLVVYVFKHRKLKVFKVASPIFLSITLLGCATMYLEVSVKVFPNKQHCIQAFRWRQFFLCWTPTLASQRNGPATSASASHTLPF